MSRKKIPFAIIYDFDGTLSPGNMQERNFIPAIGMNKKTFWTEVSSITKTHQADNILVYMKHMLDKASAASVPVRKKDFKDYGKDLSFFNGILSYLNEGNQEDGWFERINKYGIESGIKIEHYIVSSGIREMIEGTKIAKKFKSIYASSFFYDHNGVAVWPALAINYTTKTQYIFRINKGCLDVSDDKIINKYIPETKRAIPFSNMVYIGDGDTDIPCFRLVKDRGGYSIAVFKPNTRGARKKTEKLISDGRVNFIAPADYKNGSNIDKIVKNILDKIQVEKSINGLKNC
ncbi:MAG: haloacid dehalogenase-like hydrolase [Bacteroidales bacterium]|nr:haloacid dehalogenase-like hydrolase [Bacteroidales bacterium]